MYWVLPMLNRAEALLTARGLRICVERLEPRLLLATHTLLDQFNSSTFSENDGTNNWATSYTELGESDGPTAGSVQVTGGALQLGGLIASLAGRGVSRQADLSTATAATLSYTYQRTGSILLSASVTVAVSGDGGATWTDMATYTLDGSDGSFISQSFDISPYISSNTEVRVLGAGSLSVIGSFQLDDLDVTYTANDPPTVATPAAATPSTVTGTSTALSVLGADDGGESNLTYIWAATSSPVGSNPIFSDNNTNSAKDSTVTFDQAGSYTFQVTITDAGSLSTTSSVSVTVNQTLTAIAVTPSTSTLNENSTQQFSAVAYDQFGIALISQPSFTWSLTSGVGSVNSTGLYTSPGSVGSATVQAASASVSGTATVTVDNAVPTVATAASATPSPVTGTSTSLSVLGADDGGEANLTYTWAATSSPAGSNPLLSDNGTNSAKNSTVTFDMAGSYTFQVTITDAGGLFTTSSLNVTVNQTLTSITVTPPSSNLNENDTQQLGATAYDQFSAPLSVQPAFAWSIAAGVGSVNDAGLYTAPGSAGTATVQATSASVNGAATVTITNATPTVATAAGATPTTVTGTTTDLSVLGADDGGEPNLTYTWAATSSPEGSNPIFDINSSNAAKDSTVTFDMAGSYTFTATISDGNSSVTSSVDVTVNQTLTTISVLPSTTTLNENMTQSFSAAAYDQFGALLGSQPSFTWSVTSGIGAVDSSGLYTAPASTGSATVQANSGSVNDSASVTVNNAVPTVAIAAAATPATVTGTTSDTSVLGDDDGGEPDLTYTWAATTSPVGSNPIFSLNNTNAAKDSTVTFDMAGDYIFTATITDAGGLFTTSSVSVTVDQTLTTIIVSPSSSTLNENSTQQFSAAGYDQFGVALSSQPLFNWSVISGIGAVDDSGLYTAPASTGSATVQASSSSVNGSASVTVNNAVPTVATAASAIPNPVIGTGSSVSVLGADDGGEPNLTYTWVATSSPAGSNPTFSVNATNSAKDSTVTFDMAGDYTFQVTITDDGGLSVTSNVGVTVSQTLTSIIVSPSTSTLNENDTQQFGATGYDQFGIALSSQPSFTWSLASGVGSVNTTGLYTAPGSVGSATVQATSDSVSGSATVTVNNSVPTVATTASAAPNPVIDTSTSLSVLGADDGGEPNLTYTWAATISPAGSNPIFSVNATNAAKDSAVTFDMAGDYTFQVTITDAGGLSTTSSVDVTVNQTLTSITASPASTNLDENGTQQLVAVAYDQFGQTMSVQPTFTWSLASGIGTVDSNGLYTAPGSTGSATVRATSGPTFGDASVTIGNAVPTVATAASAAPSPANGTSTSLSVLGADDGGEPNLTYIWTVASSPAGSNPLFSINGTNAAKNSMVTFDMAGSYIFQVTIADAGGLFTTSNVLVTVNQTLTTITVKPASSTLNKNDSQQFSATGYDQFGIPLSIQPSFAWSVSSGIGTVDDTGLYTAPGSTGTATVTATDGSTSGSAPVTINNAVPTVAMAATASPSVVTVTNASLSVLGADDGGEANLAYTWATASSPAGSNPIFSTNDTNAAKDSIVTFDMAGTYIFTATITDADGLSTTSSVSVTVTQSLTSISVTPSTANLDQNATQLFTAIAFDQFDQTMATQPSLTWSVASGIGTVNGDGLFTAPNSAGTATVQADSGSVIGSASVTIYNAAPTAATPATASPDPATDSTTTLSVLGADDGGETNLTYTWVAGSSPIGANPIFSDNGTNTAKNSQVTFDAPGNYVFTVTVTDAGGLSTSSSVNVTVNTPTPNPGPLPPANPIVDESSDVPTFSLAAPEVPNALDASATVASHPAPTRTSPAPRRSAAKPDRHSAAASHSIAEPHAVDESLLFSATPSVQASIFATQSTPIAHGELTAAIHRSISISTVSKDIAKNAGPFASLAIGTLTTMMPRSKQIFSLDTSTVAAGTAGVAVTAAAAGYLAWCIKGGALQAGMMSAMPMWRWIDPLPILDRATPQSKRFRRLQERIAKRLGANKAVKLLGYNGNKTDIDPGERR